jgi:glycosyltransferase involved in cell wall biosynthesis
MVQKTDKIKIAFCLDLNNGWIGGLNYYRNVLMAATIANKKKEQFEFVVFHGRKSQVQSLMKINSLHFIETSALDRFSFLWLLNKLSFKFFKTDLILEIILKKNKISLLSHSNFYFNKIKTLGWIPDFQHKHLPHLFSPKENFIRDRIFGLMAELNNAIVFSSNNAKEDFLNFYTPSKKQSHFVLQFVPYLQEEIATTNEVLIKFDIKTNFFYIPNQFWVHKNHIFLLEAFAQITEKTDCLLIFSGNMDDYRFPEYKEDIKKTVQKFNLEEKVKFLGIIDYSDVIQLILNSKAVINPSLFEGWSSTVEEAKALGKNIILSDIPVHLEQAPLGGYYYKKDSKEELASLILALNDKNEIAEKHNFDQYKDNFLTFCKNYLKLLNEILDF